MDVMPQQPPQSPGPSRRRPLEASDFSGASALSSFSDPAPPARLPPLSLRTTLRRAALGVVAGAVLVTGAVVAVPEDGKKAAPPPVPGPVSRALAATASGAPAALSDLTALIGDRQQWVGTHPSDARSWAVLGTAYVEWGRRSADAAYYGRAEQALKRSLDVQPGESGNTAAWVGLAVLADARHDFGTAKKWGEAVRARRPEEWAVYPALIDAYGGLGDSRSARTAVETFTALRAGVPALLQTARMRLDGGLHQEALAAARDAAGRASTPAQKAECLSLLGELAWERGDPAESVKQYGAALRADHDHRPALAGRARALAALGRTDEAQRDYRAALARLPGPSTCWNWASCTSRWAGNRMPPSSTRGCARHSPMTTARGWTTPFCVAVSRPITGIRRRRSRCWTPRGGARTAARRWRTRWAGPCTAPATRPPRWSTRPARSARVGTTPRTRTTWA